MACVFLVCVLCCMFVAAEQSSGRVEVTDEAILSSYMTTFRRKRVEQLAATESIMEKSDYELRYKLTKALVDEMFKTLRKAQKFLLTANVSFSAPPFKNETVLSPLVTTWENSAFLSDLILRLPNMLHLQVDGHAVRLEVVKWAFETCLASPVFIDTAHRTPILLAQQELALVPADPDYTNPYRGADDPRPTKAPATRVGRARHPRLTDA